MNKIKDTQLNNNRIKRTHLSWLYGYFTNIKESMILRERKKERTGKRIGASNKDGFFWGKFVKLFFWENLGVLYQKPIFIFYFLFNFLTLAE